MDRRSFLKGLLGLAATAALAPLLPKIEPAQAPTDLASRRRIAKELIANASGPFVPILPYAVPVAELGQRGYAGEIWWKGKMIENHNWMVAIKETNDYQTRISR